MYCKARRSKGVFQGTGFIALFLLVRRAGASDSVQSPTAGVFVAIAAVNQSINQFHSSLTSYLHLVSAFVVSSVHSLSLDEDAFNQPFQAFDLTFTSRIVQSTSMSRL